MFFWRYGNATYLAATHTLVNSSLNAITFANGFDGAIVSNSTYAALKRSCVAGTTAVGLYIGCRQTIDEYAFDPLRALYHTVGVDPVGGSQQSRLTVDGKTYYYAMRSIRTYADNQLVGGLRWTSVVLTPQEDVLGEVGKGRSYSIVATVCFFIFAAACCYVLFTIFLAPLEGLEGKMEATANLADDDDKDESLSALTEVRGMQTSFYKLRGQIRKLKSFVPQSVLASLYGDDEVDGDDGEASEKATKTEGESQHDKRPSKATSDANGRSYLAQSRSDSRSPSASSTSSRGAHGKLNMALGLSKRMVTIIVFNINGLHAFAKERTMEELLHVHSKLLDAFSSLVAQGKGVVDTFQGDRFVATFNAVTPNAQHAMRAAVAATEILAAFAKLKGTLRRAAIGIATGEALVGNAGTDSQRRFCTIGRVYTHATVMERLTKQYDTADVLLTQATAGSLMHEFYTEVLDCVRFDVAKPMLLHALRGRKSHAMEEWNYAMAASEATDPYSSANEAWLKYLDGDALSARTLVNSAPGKHPGALALAGILDTNIDAADHADRTQGHFFTAGYSLPAAGTP